MDMRPFFYEKVVITVLAQVSIWLVYLSSTFANHYTVLIRIFYFYYMLHKKALTLLCPMQLQESKARLDFWKLPVVESVA